MPTPLPPPPPPSHYPLTGDVRVALEAIADMTTVLDKREPTDPQGRIERWQAAIAVQADLNTVVSQMEAEAVDAMVQMGRDYYVTSLGPVHTAPGYAREEWDGHALLGTLAQPLVNRETGEVTEAIPVSVLTDVIPSVGPGATSSKWKITGLRKYGIRIDSYHRKEPAPLRLRTGEPRT